MSWPNGNDTVMLEIKISSSNAAFGESARDAALETCRILEAIKTDLMTGLYIYADKGIRDLNGNPVGHFSYEYNAEEDDDGGIGND